MNVFNQMGKRLFKSRDKPRGWFMFGPSSSGKTVNERTAMQATAVYACVRILAESVAGLPFGLLEYKDDGTRKARDHPLYRILHDEPNPEMTSFVFRETLMSHLLLWGNAYAQIIRNGRGQVLALYPLLPDRMSVERSAGGEIFYVYRADDGGEHALKKEEVFHIPGLGFDGLIGYSPIAMAKNAVGMALATEEYGASFFANGAIPGGTIEHPKNLANLDKLRESWNSLYQGGGKGSRVAILEEGMKYSPVGIPPEQAQFLQTRKFQINEIARVFRVPPHMIGDLEKSSFNNIEQQSLEFVKYTLGPWLVRWEQAVDKDLLLPREKCSYFAKLNVDGLLRGDFEKRIKGYAIGIQNGFYSPNDALRMEDMNLIPAEEGGDLHMINGNMCRLDEVGIAYRSKQRGGG
jgi:HK97 family phage portal protein